MFNFYQTLVDGAQKYIKTYNIPYELTPLTESIYSDWELSNYMIINIIKLN